MIVQTLRIVSNRFNPQRMKFFTKKRERLIIQKILQWIQICKLGTFLVLLVLSGAGVIALVNGTKVHPTLKAKSNLMLLLGFPKSQMHAIRLPKNHFHAFLKDRGNCIRSPKYQIIFSSDRIYHRSCFSMLLGILTLSRFCTPSESSMEMLLKKEI